MLKKVIYFCASTWNYEKWRYSIIDGSKCKWCCKCRKSPCDRARTIGNNKFAIIGCLYCVACFIGSCIDTAAAAE